MKQQGAFVLVCLSLCLVQDVFGKEYAPRPQSHKTKECPPGFTLNGKLCEAIEIVDPKQVCPPGTSNVDGRCVTQAPVKLQCPAGYTMKQVGKTDGECVQVQSAPADYYCDEGELEGRQCKLVTMRNPVCPAGYTMSADTCVKYASVLKKCPSGYAQSGKQCSKRVGFPASPVCDQNMQLSSDGQKCYRFDERKPYCPSGYTWNNAGQCMRPVQKVKAPCPVGYRSTGTHCEAQEEHEADVSCPVDMQLEDRSLKVCSKAVPVPPKCPAGYLPSKSVLGHCDRFVPSVSVCPSRTVPSGEGVCKQTIETDKYPECPKGFELIGEKCKKVEEFPTRPVCLTGRLQGEQCVSSETIAPQYACPGGYELTKTQKGPQCTQVVQYDCSTTVMKRECEMPDFVEQLHGRKLKSDYAPKAVQRIHTSGGGKQPVCRQVPVQQPRTCTKQEVAPVKYVCPENGQLVGKMCKIEQYTPADVICTGGDMDVQSGRCLKISNVMPTYKCAVGKDMGSKCVQYENLPADYICPDGTQVDGDYGKDGKLKCVDRKPQMEFPDQIVKQKAKISCSTGILKGKTCVNTIKSPVEYVCPEGSFPSEEAWNGADLKCAVTVEQITPPAVEIKVLPKYVCPDEKPAPNKVCYTTEEVAIEEYCPSKFDMDYASNRCVTAAKVIVPAPVIKHTPAKPVCNEGYSLQGSTCRTTMTVPAEKLCAHGYSMEFGRNGKDVCVKEHQMQPICPPGTVMNAEGCTRRKTVAPEVTIVRTCTKGTPGCH